VDDELKRRMDESRRQYEEWDAEFDAFETLMWRELPGTVYARLTISPNVWAVHELGIVRFDFERKDERAVGIRGDLTQWHDVRDVEVSWDIQMFGEATPMVEWTILTQYPRISVKGSDEGVGRFALALARMARPR
jgi:hypothetical protein